jgi:hypothetical protein
MIFHLDQHGDLWTLDLLTCVPVVLLELGPIDPATGEPESVTTLPGVRLDVAPAGMHPSLQPFVVHPSVRRHDFGPDATAILAPAWSDLFFPGAAIWRRAEVEAEDPDDD